MSDAAAASPEVADACRRAGLPYQLGPSREVGGIDGMAAMASPAPGSYQGGELARAITDLQAATSTMALLYGPALPAPIAEVAGRLRTAWDGYSFEAWEGARRRDQLKHEVDQLRRVINELAGERNRARDTAVALEQELAGLDDLAGGRAPLLEVLGIPVELDDTLPPDVAELRGATTVRIRIGDAPARGGGVADIRPVAAADTSGAPGASVCATCSSPVGAPHLPGCSQVKAGLAAAADPARGPRLVTEADESGCAGASGCALCSSPVGSPHLPTCSGA